jgi:siderophore synthetase component
VLQENGFGGRLSVLSESYGLHIKELPEEKAKHLSAIFRENVNAKLKKGEIAIVVAALLEKSPISNVSIFIELMQSTGVHLLSQAVNYFKQYVDVLLGSYLNMYLIYGIGLEGHQQNTLAVFSKGRISRFIARDFDATKIHAPRLKNLDLNLSYGSKNLRTERKDVRNFFLHTVYQCHLGEVVLSLAKHFECKEQVFWQVIKSITEQQFFSLKDKLEANTWYEEYQTILKKDWACKGLLQMRLCQKERGEGHYFNIANPLKL